MAAIEDVNDPAWPLWQLSASALTARYRSGRLSPVEVVEAVLSRMDAVNPTVNAVVARRDAAVRAEADASARRWAAGHPLSVLDGVPLTVKDSLYWADLPTTCGTPALRDHCPGHDELAAARARAGGALMIGKTNVPEFANEGYTGNPLFGVTGNPWNPALTPGGSSGGAVAAVAAGIGPVAIAQDGGGSIRRPASHTGLVGLKPTIGAWAREQMLPGLLLDFDVIGPVARTVADCRLLFDALRGPSDGDRHSLAAAQAAARAAARPRTGPLKLLVVEHLFDNPLEPQIRASFRRAVDRLAGLGHVVETGPLPLDIAGLQADWPLIGQVGLAALFERHPEWGAQATERFRDMAAHGRELPGWRVWRWTEQVRALRLQAATLFERIDAVVMPAAAALPWPAAEFWPPEIDGQPVGPRGHAVYTGWVNAAGLPGLALPCDPSDDGMPIGLQLVGGAGQESMLLDLGEAFEAIEPWAQRWPAL